MNIYASASVFVFVFAFVCVSVAELLWKGVKKSDQVMSVRVLQNTDNKRLMRL